jgi:hypothetical protein
MLILGMAAPVLGATTSRDIVVTSSYAPRLVVDWSGAPDINFGEVRTWTYDAPAQTYESPLGYVRVTVTSNLPYTSTLTVADGVNAAGGLLLAGGFNGLRYYRGDGNYATVVVIGDNGFGGMAGVVGVGIPGFPGGFNWDQNWFNVDVPVTVPSGTLHVIATFTITQTT